MMMQTLPQLFDFSIFNAQSESYVALIQQFCAAPPFRSATVDELVLDDDYHRRPLRPEDCAFLKFKKPIQAHTVSRLPALAANRMLLSIYELSIARLPRSDDAAEWQHCSAFYCDETKTLGTRIAPFLEAYAFEFLAKEACASDSVAALSAQLTQLVDTELEYWRTVFARLLRHDYLEEGLRFIMVQRWALAASQRHAFAQAAASGFFSMLPPDERPTLHRDGSDDALLERAAAACGITRRQHAYWQFYLPTSLAKCNLLYALARRPDRAFGFIGAAFGAQAQWLAFSVALERACPHLQPASWRSTDAAARQAEFARRCTRALQRIAADCGAHALAQCSQGVTASTRLAERGRWDLGEQLRWLSSIPAYVEFAHRISGRIDAECPGIDRETFVEPREMCSTTHVHNDHRLVTIQAGEMLFWGNVGIQLKMNQGDQVLIPDGRLHGSTVVSGECTYHQPIIPDDWVQALVAELDQPAVAVI